MHNKVKNKFSINTIFQLFFFSLIVLISLVLKSCAPLKLSNDKDKYLDRVYLLNNNTKVEREVLDSYIRQRGNYKILGTDENVIFKYRKLAISTNNFVKRLINEKKVIERKERRNKRYNLINEKRIAKTAAKNQKNKQRIEATNNKRIEKAKKLNEQLKDKANKFYEPLLIDFKAEIPSLKDKDKPTLLENIRNIGQVPVILDTSLTKKSSEQLKLFLQTIGYFNAEVRDSTVIKNSGASVYYKFNIGPKAVIKAYEINSPDTTLLQILKQRIQRKIKVNEFYSRELVDLERADITKHLKENGYYYFTQNYIKFYINNKENTFEPRITAEIAPFQITKDSTDKIQNMIAHTRYSINRVLISTEFEPFNLSSANNFKDTTVYLDYFFIHNKPLEFRPKAFKNVIQIKSKRFLNTKEIQETYKKLTELKMFKYINLQFTKMASDSTVLNCTVQLYPIVKQTIGLSGEGTNNSGNLGIGGSIIYQNRNTTKGAELLSLKIGGGLQAQRSFNSDLSSSNFIFNTIELGPEVNFSLPRAAFPFSLFKYATNASPKTNIIASYNYQIREKLFNRNLANVSYGLEFNAGKYKRHFFVPLEITFVKAVIVNDTLKKIIRETDDLVYKNGFLDHVTTVSRYSYIFKKEELEFSKFQKFFKLDIESSGNLLRLASNLLNRTKDADNSYQFFGIRFAQFIKLNTDFRIYKNLNKSSKIAYRIFGGLGIPLKNLNTLPFEKIYFSGGPNSIRAWKARTLGPGGFNTPNERLDNFGDILLESNIEYRFDIYKFVKGALFADAGNVWLLNPQKEKENGEFQFDQFYKQIALGSGLGIRLDFTYFIVRLDAGLKMHNPANETGKRWLSFKQSVNSSVLNFGIGYPF